jgi:hypothetical protein
MMVNSWVPEGRARTLSSHPPLDCVALVSVRLKRLLGGRGLTVVWRLGQVGRWFPQFFADADAGTARAAKGRF